MSSSSYNKPTSDGPPATTADLDKQPGDTAEQYPPGSAHVTAAYRGHVPSEGVERLLDLTDGGTLHVNGHSLSVTGRTDGENPRDLADRLYDALPRPMACAEVHWAAGTTHDAVAGDDIPF